MPENTSFNWSNYYKNHLESKAQLTLVKGLENLNKLEVQLQKKSIDIGSGQGSDVAELLSQGWDTIAVDKEPEAEQIVIKRFAEFHGNKLITKVQKMEDIVIPKVTLINASFSLPFCHPNNFPELWTKITSSITTGGIFCGQLFGEDDGWATNDEMIFHHRNSLDSLFNGFRIHFLHEENRIATTSSGEEKNWHVYHLVAVKLK
ncbi:MAG: class I SAM-dependent methyltransferase [Candidatus Marinimicrobia bacterium]|nr:class I SAM-dependent methyltransferase [Candidatus Neomarinimicrobiota bacterium]